MFDLVRYSTHRVRAWLIATAAILLVTSVLEAGHAHDVVTPEDNHCTLCQHTISLDKTFSSSAGFILPVLLSVFICIGCIRFTAAVTQHFVLIRAPPNNSNTH